MKIRELKDEPLIKRLPVDNDSYDRVLPDNRIKVSHPKNQPAQPQFYIDADYSFKVQ